MNRRWQAGFTMVETVIAMSLLMAAIYAGMTLMDAQKRSSKVRNIQTMYRYLAIQTASIVTGNPERFPALSFSSAWDDSRDVVMYVACYDKGGNLLPNDLGTRDFVFHQMRRNELDLRQATTRCPNPPTGIVSFEVRFWFNNPTTREVYIEILDLVLLRSRNPRSIPKQRFTIYR